MALKNILDILAADFGLDMTNSEQRALTLSFVNKAAEELYRMDDLEGSLAEMVVNIDNGKQQVALPPSVEHVRGGRYYESRQALEIDHISNRYLKGSTEVWPLTFRKKGSMPISRSLENQSILKFSIPAVEASDIVISIKGSTDRSSAFYETLTITAGELEVESSENYKGIFSIRKDRVTTYDVSIADVEDNDLGVIPNTQLFSRYIIWQVSDSEYSGSLSTSGSLEILYKKAFVPFHNDYDQFLDNDKFDLAIIEKFKELRSKNSDAFQLYQMKANQSMQIAHEDSQDTRRKVGFPRSPYFDLPYHV